MVTDVHVGLHGLTTGSMDDLDLLLVGPDGNQALILSDAGGARSFSDLDLTFNDQAASAPSDDGLVASGAYKPVNYGGDEHFPAAPPFQGAARWGCSGIPTPTASGACSPGRRERPLLRARRLVADVLVGGHLPSEGTVTIDGGAAATSHHR